MRGSLVVRPTASGSLSVVLVDLDAGAESGGRRRPSSRGSPELYCPTRASSSRLSDLPGRPTDRPVAVAAVIPPLTCVAPALARPPVRRPRARVFFHPRVTPKSQSELACLLARLPACSSPPRSSLLHFSDGALLWQHCGAFLGAEWGWTELRRGRRVACLSGALVAASQRNALLPSFAALDDSLAPAPDSICTTMPLQFVLLLFL